MQRRWMKATYAKQLDELIAVARYYNAYMTAPMCETWTACGLQDRKTTA